jgi:hypothetical protein
MYCVPGTMGRRQRTTVFGTAPSPLAGTLAPQDTGTVRYGTNDTIGMVSVCTDVQRRVGKVLQVYDAKNAARPPQIHATKYEAPGPLWYTTKIRSKNRGYLSTREASRRQMLRPMAIGHPITRPNGSGCIGVDPHHGYNQQTPVTLDHLIRGKTPI